MTASDTRGRSLEGVRIDQTAPMYWKLLTHDFRPPVQGGDPVWDGKTLPFKFPTVPLDTSEAECSYGWNYVADLANGFKVAGLWRTGRPNAVAVVTPAADAIRRGSKLRASSLTIERLATDAEIAQGVREFSRVFGDHQERMVEEQLAWRNALARPKRDEEAVAAGLSAALAARGLAWRLNPYGDARAARDARDAWAARDAWDARAARAARDAWDAWDARDAWAARDAWDARDALTVCFTALQGWIKHDPLLLTAGIRDAYANGLELAAPVGKDTLGYAMTQP